MNVDVASKRNPGGRAFLHGAKAAWIVADWPKRRVHSGGVTATARWQGCAKQLEKPSSPRREIGGEGNRITGALVNKVVSDGMINPLLRNEFET